MQLYLHFTRQAVPVIVRVKKKRRMPVMIAPNILVAANVTPRRTIENITVPTIPKSTVFR